MDLVLWGANKAAIRQFAINRGLIAQVDDGEGGTSLVKVRDFDFTWWAGDGQFKTKEWDVRLSRNVSVIREYIAPTPAVLDDEGNVITPRDPGQPAEFAFNVGAQQVPAWIEDAVARRGVKVIGRYVRTQGNFVVFSGEAEVGESLNICTPDIQFAPGVVALLRINIRDDALTPDENDPDAGKQWTRSKIARAIRNNGTAGTTAGIPHYEWDNVRLLWADTVQTWLANRGLPGHEWLGGNSF